MSQDRLFALASPERTATLSTALEERPIDWSLCFVCGCKEGKSVLEVQPYARKDFDATKPETYGTYKSFPPNLKKAIEVGALPTVLKGKVTKIIGQSSLSSEEALQQAFVENKAIFHKKCIVKYNENHLKRLLSNDAPGDHRSHSPKKTRSSFNATNFVDKCFFCDSGDGILSKCATKSLNKHVNSWARFLKDSKLLAKLSEGDMPATEAKYHKKCLTDTFNKVKVEKRKNQCKERELLTYIEKLAMQDVIQYIKDTIANDQENDTVPVFTQKSLSDFYKKQIIHHGSKYDNIDAESFANNTHATRMREKILAEIPGLCMANKGREVTLTLNDDLGRALYSACSWSSEEIDSVLSKTAKIIRKKLFECDEVFNGDLSLEKQITSVPGVLVKLVSLILEGGSPNQDISENLEKISTNIGQLIRYNSVKQKRRENVRSFRHSKKNEPPLPVLIGLMIHAKTGKRSVVDILASKGLSINYERVLEIKRAISNQVCSKYQESGMVCPSQLKDNIFTTAAIDNLDHNLTSATSQGSFHGTTISIFQHPSDPLPNPLFLLETSNTKRSTRLSLPESFTELRPTAEPKSEPTQNTRVSDSFKGTSIHHDVTSWLEVLGKDSEEGTKRNFSSFYSKDAVSPIKCGSHLLPLIQEPVTCPATVRHAVHIIRKITGKVNPGQMSVVTGDQPVYALGKQLQWKFPEEFGDTIWMLGPLHIEQMFLKLIGEWLEKSGWVEVYDYALINPNGKADSFLTCSGGAGIKRARYAHQLTLAALSTLANEAFNNQEEFSEFSLWRKDVEEKSATAKYWFTVMDLEALLFTFLKSLRLSDFNLFLEAFEEMMPWVAVLDHTHYMRWGSVFLDDMRRLPESIKKSFDLGNFTVKKSSRVFSAIGIDQAHEQNNKRVKVDGGAIGIMDNESALLEWALSGPYIAEMIQETDQCSSSKHHEDTDSFEKEFCLRRVKLINSFKYFENPFEDPHKELVNIASKVIMSTEAATSVREALRIGNKQCLDFLNKRLNSSEKDPTSIYEPVKKNNLTLFRSKSVAVTSKKKRETAALKERVQLFSNLYIGCKSRQANLDDFFRHENHEYPPSLSDYGNIRKPLAKSDFLKCLVGDGIDQEVEELFDEPSVEAALIDGAALVQMTKPKTSKTFGEYVKSEIGDKIKSRIGKVEQLDLVFDVYKKGSRKRETRENRSKEGGIHISIKDNTPIYRNFAKVLKVDQNKTELFELIAQSLVTEFNNHPKALVVTSKENVLSNRDISLHALMPCHKEEADDRMFLHALEQSRNGFKKLVIVTVDTDVVVIALYCYWDLDLEKLWIEFGDEQEMASYTSFC